MTNSSQVFESYVPVYDALPTNWENATPEMVERMKAHANAINIRAIGWMLDEELLSGFQFIPGATDPNNNVAPQYRTVLRKVIDTGSLAIGAKAVPHGITFDANFTLIDLWVSATNSTTFIAQNIAPGNVTMDSININITSTLVFDRSFAQILYIQEV